MSANAMIVRTDSFGLLRSLSATVRFAGNARRSGLGRKVDVTNRRL
jgi:hypothetical protein